MMPITHVFHVPKYIDELPMRWPQYMIIILCGLVMFLDGFDTQSISYMAPLIAKEWGLQREMLGPIFSSALVGLMIGYLVLAPLSDRFGHRRMILVSTVAFGVFTAINALATNVTELLILRFITGMTLGAAIPSVISLTSEYNPKRLRATVVLIIYCGYSLGFVAAGAVAAWLMPLHGWRVLFWVGGIAPLALAIFLYASLPESLDYLIRKQAPADRIWAALRALSPGLARDPDVRSFSTDAVGAKSPIRNLFRDGRGFGTALLWIVFFLNLAAFYALQSWLPSILTNLKYSLNTTALATSLTTIGGIAIVAVIGPAMDRLGAYRSLATLYLVGVVSVAAVGIAAGKSELLLLVATFFAGACISGGQKSAIALAALYYPIAMRSTGVGWALGIGRLGGIGGPLLLGHLFSSQVNAEAIFYVLSIPMLIAGLLVAVMGFRYGGRASSAALLDTQPSPGPS